MKDNETDAYSTIMAFEQILEVMPDDRGALESVARAYEELGDQIQARQYIVRLVRVLLDEGDLETTSAWADKLRLHAQDEPDILALLEEVESRSGDGGGMEAGAEPAGQEAGRTSRPPVPDTGKAATAKRVKGVRMQLSIADEMAFAWNLLQVELLSEEEYANVVQDLTELGTDTRSGTVSVLHALHGRGFGNLDKLLVAVARETYMPLIDLRCFEIPRDAATSLPLEFIIHRGALPFERIGSEILVALLNPFDESLRQDTETLAGCPCHWYLTKPEGFDQAVEKVRELLA